MRIASRRASELAAQPVGTALERWYSVALSAPPARNRCHYCMPQATQISRRLGQCCEAAPSSPRRSCNACVFRNCLTKFSQPSFPRIAHEQCLTEDYVTCYKNRKRLLGLILNRRPFPQRLFQRTRDQLQQFDLPHRLPQTNGGAHRHTPCFYSCARLGGSV